MLDSGLIYNCQDQNLGLQMTCKTTSTLLPGISSGPEFCGLLYNSSDRFSLGCVFSPYKDNLLFFSTGNAFTMIPSFRACVCVVVQQDLEEAMRTQRKDLKSFMTQITVEACELRE